MKELSYIWRFFIEKRAITWIVLLAIIIMGFFSLSNLPREIQPEVKIPYIMVSAILPGANPIDTESLLTEPLEKEISSVPDIKMLSSSSGFGISFIFIEFETKANIDDSLQEVKDAVDKAKISFPEDALDPVIQKAEANKMPIITFSVTGDLQVYELTKIAETIKDYLEKIDNVSSVEILGSQKKYIEITLNQSLLEAYGLTIDQIAAIVKFANNNVPVGIITSDKLNYSIRIDNRYASIEDIRNLPLFSIQDESATLILLKDIAKVEKKFPVENVISKVSENGEKSQKAVSLQIYNKEKSNILTITEDAKLLIDELKADGTIPHDVNIVVTNDNSVFISEELGNLVKNGYETIILILIALFLAFSLTQGIIAGLSIPVIFLITFSVMDWQGISINTLSLFALVMSLGMIVDNMIVIMEGIHTGIKKYHLNVKEAALLSVNTYKWPLTSGTLTTVFAFLPMLLVSGIMGEFLKTLPITIAATLLASLFVALTIGPSITTKFLKAEKETTPVLGPFFKAIGSILERFVSKIIHRRSFRFFTIIIPTIAFILSMLLPITGKLKVEMFPATDQHYFTITIETLKGTVIEETKRITEEVENYLYEIPEIENFLTQIGTSSSIALTGGEIFMSGGSTESNLANITVNLVEKDLRSKQSYEIAKEVRDHFKYFTNAKISINEIKEGPPGEAAITVRITGKNMETLKSLADEVKKIIENIPKTNNTGISLKSGLNEFKFTLDKDLLALHGLSSIEVSAMIRNIVQGVEAGEININGEDIDIIAKYNNFSISDIENFKIPTKKGYSIELSELGTYSLEQSLSSIEREDQKRIIKVISDIEKDTNAVDIYAQIEEQIKNIDIPSGYDVTFGGDLEEIAKSFKELFMTMIVSIILIGFVLVLEFNSFKQPLIILFSLPLALIAVFPGLMILGLNFSFPAFLGIIALAGIVVNNAIVLLDRINQSISEGIPLEEAVPEATKARFEPIFMTSITTIIGVIPLALSNEFWAGIGFSLAFGLTCSTILTLIIIPVLYYSFEHKTEK